jgi:hypothetical protein
MRHLRTAIRSALVLYLVAGIVGLLQFYKSMSDRSGVPHDISDSVLAIILGLPWSLLFGVLLHPNSGSGLVILAVSIGGNLALLTWLARTLSSGLGTELPDPDRLARFASFVGYAATIAWAVLAVLTITSLVIRPGPNALVVTLAVAAAFIVVSAILYWRTSAVAAISKDAQRISAKMSLTLSEIVSALAMLMLGVLLLTAVASRIFGEGLPLFG